MDKKHGVISKEGNAGGQIRGGGTQILPGIKGKKSISQGGGLKSHTGEGERIVQVPGAKKECLQRKWGLLKFRIGREHVLRRVIGGKSEKVR